MPSRETLAPGVRGQRGSAKTTGCSRRGKGISSAVEQSKKEPMLGGPVDLRLKPASATYCVILHKLLSLPEPYTLY